MEQPFQLFSCKWAWCRLTFPDNTRLIQHVVHDHVRRAIPVRRRDISMIKRAEEGKGESFKISELMVDMYSYTSLESISHKPGTNPSFRHSFPLYKTDIILLQVEHPQELPTSLPSPPASSPVLRSPHHHSPGPAPSPSPLSLEWELSQHAEEYPTSDPISQSQSDGHHHLENLPVMSQPPSRLRLDPSAAVPLSSPPASSPTIAVSTPLRQNWYQPPIKRRKRSTCNDIDSGPLQITPGSPSEESKAKHVIVDALPANHQNNLATPPTRPHSPCNLFLQSSQDSSDLSEINSYPALQTQAPYQSQILTQV